MNMTVTGTKCVHRTVSSATPIEIIGSATLALFLVRQGPDIKVQFFFCR